MSYFTIKPGVGVGPLVLGMSKEETVAALGQPDETTIDDEVGSDDWLYVMAGLELTFDHGFSRKLSDIALVKDTAALGGANLIGISESQFLYLCKSCGVEPEREELLHLVEYSWPAHGLTFFFEEGCVRTVHTSMLWQDDVTPIWPTETRRER